MTAVLAAGMPLTVGFPLIQLLGLPWTATTSLSSKSLNAGPVSFTIFFAVASAVVSVGGVLFGVATIRARVFSRQLGIGFIVLAAASFVLGFLSLPGGGGIAMSWWWGTTGTFGVVAYMVALAWVRNRAVGRISGAPDSAGRGRVTGWPRRLPNHGRTEPPTRCQPASGYASTGHASGTGLAAQNSPIGVACATDAIQSARKQADLAR